MILWRAPAAAHWVQRKWKVRRGYLEIHIAVDVKRKKILALKVTDENVGDGRMLQPLVEEASEKAKVAKRVADGAYDSERNSQYLSGRQMEPCIKCGKSIGQAMNMHGSGKHVPEDFKRSKRRNA